MYAENACCVCVLGFRREENPLGTVGNNIHYATLLKFLIAFYCNVMF
jgi:hypothetical protein